MVPMKIIIRAASQKSYCDARGKWVKKPDKAMNFRSTANAISFAAERHLGPLEVFHVFPEQEYNFTTGILDYSKSNARKRA